MFVRSQGKTRITDIKDFYITVISEKLSSSNQEKELYTINGFAKYSTMEKALKVLDMIQLHIEKQGQMFIRCSNGYSGPVCERIVTDNSVFTFPLDSEVF